MTILPQPTFDFLAGGGEMGELIRQFDWAATPIGPPETWPQSLRVTIRLMLNTGHPMFVWWGPELIQFYNDAYRRTMGPERHPSALGQRGRECWDEIWHIIGPQIEHVMAGKGSTWHEDALVPVTRHGRLEQVYWTYSYGPIDLDGRIGGILVVCTDVTRQHNMRDALRAQYLRQSALFEAAPGFMAVMRGPEHTFELTNAAYRHLIGERNVIGLTVRQALPDIEGQGFYELLDRVYQTGEPYVGRQVPIQLERSPGQPHHQLFLDFIYQPIVEDDGTVSGIFVQGVDVTDHVRAKEHLQLINFELKHRVKNTLAMVSAIATQTLRSAGVSPQLDAFRARLGAFGRAHDILTAETWATAEIHDVVGAALSAHDDGHSYRIAVSGPQVILGSKQAVSLALAIHELSTNATKYGALSVPGGSVSVRWDIVPRDGNEWFEFTWEERGGPPVGPPSHRGFGSTLIERVLNADFGGDLRLDFAPAGLSMVLGTGVDRLRSDVETLLPAS